MGSKRRSESPVSVLDSGIHDRGEIKVHFRSIDGYSRWEGSPIPLSSLAPYLGYVLPKSPISGFHPHFFGSVTKETRDLVLPRRSLRGKEFRSWPLPEFPTCLEVRPTLVPTGPNTSTLDPRLPPELLAEDFTVPGGWTRLPGVRPRTLRRWG